MTTIHLNALKDRAYKTACEHGFHDQHLPDEHWLMLVFSELAEAVEADRKNHRADLLAFDKEGDSASRNWTSKMPYSFVENFNKHIKNSVEDELADVVIRLLDFAGVSGINLEPLVVPVRRSALGNSMTVFSYDVIRLFFTSAPLQLCIHAAISMIFEKCEHDDIDLLRFISLKMSYNETRERKHGKKY